MAGERHGHGMCESALKHPPILQIVKVTLKREVVVLFETFEHFYQVKQFHTSNTYRREERKLSQRGARLRLGPAADSCAIMRCATC